MAPDRLSLHRVSEGRLIAAWDEGADAVLMRGFQIEDLSAAIERIIHPGK
jgi:hypothetical protein